MSDWESRAEISGDVVFFEYVTSEKAHSANEVFVWDLDKTYLDTHFETLRGLYRTIIEKAFQKRNIPGTSSLVRNLTVKDNQVFPIYFITASPPQMEEKIREKLRLDGIQPYGIFCKDNLKNLTPSRFRRLNQQIGYKVQALLQLRASLSESVKQILWGDDSESDAIIYSLYSDICSRRLEGINLEYVLSQLKVRGEQLRDIQNLQDKIPVQDPVSRIYINLATDTDPEYYHKFGYRTLPTYNTFQVAMDLYQDQHINIDQLSMVAQDMLTNYDFSKEELAESISDLINRKMLHKECVENMVESMKREALLPFYYQAPQLMISSQEYNIKFHGESDISKELWIPQFIDYLHDFR